MRLTLALVVALALASPSAVAQQQQSDPEQLLQTAEKYYEQLEYEQALRLLIQVHQSPGVQPMQRARAFLYMGVCFTALGNAENAVLAFVELLKVKPTFRLPPGISPSIAAMFKEALTRMKLPETPGPDAQQGGGQGESDVKLEAKAPSRATAGQPVDVAITVKDPNKVVQRLVLGWRRVGGSEFSTIKVPYKTGDKEATARIPGATVGKKTGTLQVVVAALADGDRPVAQAGTIESPLVVRLVKSRGSTIKWKWWAIGVGSGLAIIGGVVAGVLLTRGGQPSGPGNGSAVTVTIH